MRRFERHRRDERPRLEAMIRRFLDCADAANPCSDSRHQAMPAAGRRISSTACRLSRFGSRAAVGPEILPPEPVFETATATRVAGYRGLWRVDPGPLDEPRSPGSIWGRSFSEGRKTIGARTTLHTGGHRARTMHSGGEEGRAR